MTIRIVHCSVLEYQALLHRPFRTARKTITGNVNYLTLIFAEKDGRQVIGIGESAPRGVQMTADPTVRVWDFMNEVADCLTGVTLDSRSAAACVTSIRTEFGAIEDIATRMGADVIDECPGGRPFRGSISGVETAVLDACAQLFDMTLGAFLGNQRTDISVTATTTSAGSDFASYRTQLASNGKRFPAWRIKGDARVEVNLDYLRNLTELNRRKFNMTKFMWIDINEALSEDEARDFLAQVIADHDAGLIEGKLVVEQPVKKADYKALPRLQAFADSQPREGLKIVVMADESLFGLNDWRKLEAEGGCGAINIKVPKAGGLLAALDIAQAATQFNPEIEVYLGGMLATSDIMSYSILNLARALPRFDYTTSGPNMNVMVNIASNRLLFKSGGTSELALPQTPGLGTALNYVLLAPNVLRSYPQNNALFSQKSTLTKEGLALHSYERPDTSGMAQKALDSYLLETAALARGLPVRRLSKLIFFCDPDKTEMYKLGFWWTGSSLSTKAYNMVCGQKQWTRNFLRASGIVVPQGRQFQASQHKDGLSYAKSLGWPVVVKPGDGSGGRAVTSNIQSEEAFTQALGALKPKESFIVEQHIPGEDYRVMVTADRVLSVLRRVPSHVIGDGLSSIADLVARANATREANPRYGASLIKLERATSQAQLSAQGLTNDSILPAGKRIELSTAANVSQGGEAIDVTAETHPSILEYALKIRQTLPELGHIGIDILMEDHTQAFEDQAVGICEVNAYGELAMHVFPSATSVSANEFAPGTALIDDVFTFNLRHYTQEDLPARDLITVQMRANGVNKPKAFQTWLAERIDALGVSASNISEERVGTGVQLSVTLTGWASHVASITSQAIGPAPGVVSEYVETTMCPAQIAAPKAMASGKKQPSGIHVLLSGKVQGVGYRAWLQKLARTYAVRGFVRNRSDGKVEAVLSATQEVLDIMQRQMRVGPDGTDVTQIDVKPYYQSPKANDFLRYKTVSV